MAILTDQGTGTSLGMLELLQLEDSADGLRRYRPGRMQRRLIPTLGELPAIAVPALLEELFYGPGRPGRRIEARFEGAHPILVRRDGTKSAELEIGGRVLDLGGKTPGEIVFGVKAEAFHDETILHGRDFIIPAGAEALRVELRKLLQLPAIEKRDSNQKAEELENLRKRRRLLEHELAALPRAGSVDFEPADPPAVGDLLEALEASREVDRRIMTRRLELAAAFEKAARQPAANLVPPSAEILKQLEQVADEIEAEGRTLEDLRVQGENRSAFWGPAGAGLIFLVALLSFFGGKSLDEPFLVQVGAGLAGLALLFVLSVWYGRVRSIMQTTKEARRLRQGRQKLRERAKALCARVGAVADPDDLTPENIRELIDRVSRRDFSRVLKEIVTPFVDAPAELSVVKKLARALETPLMRAAELTDPKVPAVPLVRATRAAMSLAQQWSEALAECARRVEAGVEAKVRQQLEREMLEEALQKLRFSERSLELAVGSKAKPENGQTEKAARRVTTRLLPLLQRHLGQRAPRSVDADLNLNFDVEPSASTNAFILFAARLIDLRDPSFRRDPLGRFLVDATLALAPEDEVALAQLVASLPQAGTLSLGFSRPEFEASFRRMAQPLMPALIDTAPERNARSVGLYSAHADSRPIEPRPAHVLL